MSDDATKDIADVKRYIRTYADDLAKASGAAPPADAKHPSYVPQKPEPKPVSTPAPGAPFELDALTESTEPVSQFAPPKAAPKHVPDTSREEVLERLRARVATYQKPAAPVAQAPELAPRPAPTPDTLATPGPSIDPFREPIEQTVSVPPIRMGQVPLSAPVPQAVPKAPATKDRTVPDSGHTFSSDFKQHAERTGANTFSVIAAEANKKEREAPKPLATKKPSAVVPILMGLLAISLAGAGMYGVYTLLTSEEIAPIASAPSALVFADEETILEGPNYFSELVRLSGEQLPAGTVLVAKARDESLAGILLSGAPDLLLRNVSPESTVGIVNAGASTNTFFALKVGSYERTFAGMLAFEPELTTILGELYGAYTDEPVEESTATTTDATAGSTTTTSFVPATSTPNTFTDAIIANHDVRVLRDRQGRSLVLYGYASKNLLIIARDESAFSELLSRVRP